MELVFAGIDRAAAPLDIWRSASRIDPSVLLDALAASPDVVETMVISDGGRFEAYVVLNDGFDSFEMLAGVFASCVGCASSQVISCLYAAEGFDAVLHAIYTACGLDALSRPDSSSADALRAACALAEVHGASGERMRRLVAAATEFGRQNAGFNESAMAQSRAAAALGLARFVFDDLPKRFVLAVGESRTGEALCELLEACGAAVGRIATQDGAWRSSFTKADMVLFCDEQAGRVFSAAEAKRMRRARKGRMGVVFDLTENGCVDAGCVGFDDLFVYTAADLRDFGGGGAVGREQSETSVVQRAREEAHGYMRWFDECRIGQGVDKY